MQYDFSIHNVNLFKGLFKGFNSFLLIRPDLLTLLFQNLQNLFNIKSFKSALLGLNKWCYQNLEDRGGE